MAQLSTCIWTAKDRFQGIPEAGVESCGEAHYPRVYHTSANTEELANGACSPGWGQEASTPASGLHL